MKTRRYFFTVTYNNCSTRFFDTKKEAEDFRNDLIKDRLNGNKYLIKIGDVKTKWEQI